MIESFKITSINAGVDVTFIHTEGCECNVPNPHEVNISGPLVPYDNADALEAYLKEWGRAYNEGKMVEVKDNSAEDNSTMEELINTSVTIE